MVLLTLAFLIGLNVLFVLMEYALVRVRPARIELLARQGNARAARVQEMLVHLDDYLAAIQVGITLVALALGSFAEPPITAFLQGYSERLLGDLPDKPLRVFSLAFALGALAYIQIVVGELLPRAIALQKAERLALWGALPLKVFALICRIPVLAMSRSSALLLRAFRFRPASEAEAAVSEEEMRVLLGETQEKGILPLERMFLLENLFDFGAAKAAEVMTPLDKVAFLSLKKSWEENREVIRARRFSRYPLCEDGPQSVVGLLHVKDLVLKGAPPDLAALRREIAVVPESEPLEKLLKSFPDKGVHMAMVRKASGEFGGLLTLEDIIEELVGEVHDEFDLPQAWSLAEFVVAPAVAVAMSAQDRESAIRQLMAKLKGAAPEFDENEIARMIWERELKFSSAVGRGVAVPHARLPNLNRPLIALGRFAKPVPFPAPDAIPVRLIFLVLTPASQPLVQLRILARIAALATNENLRRKLLRAKTAEAMLDILRTADTLLAS